MGRAATVIGEAPIASYWDALQVIVAGTIGCHAKAMHDLLPFGAMWPDMSQAI